ncbi:hypothetical protein [Actinoplanes palleronii]|uniref:PBP domain-containing protein n=1 Tax=Actinoplanes palleronii TaxID=113570 RepID=A0ABQ4B6L1_9ACTN|nr:hypothetical protein [Actinoplanes palleronii]GIE66222.1 hypothetical protein Apa02nite_023300 [Actinoplanes palleronii]
MIRRAAAAVLTVVLMMVCAPVGPAAAADSSAVTVSGRGVFGDLKVTVSQTSNLINQVVTVSWTGGRPTGDIAAYQDYLQIMQCWGNAAGGPTREQCQFGALFTDNRGGLYTGSRRLNYASYCAPADEQAGKCTGLRDPLETAKPLPSNDPVYVPFTPVEGKAVPGPAGGEYFDSATTNEMPYARTGADGRGEEFFEVQTASEAPGLGCGTQLANGTGRACWLVIVPRGESEVDGTTGDAKPHHALDSSPLSATNWANRLVVPMKFQPLGRVCPIGGAEKRAVGAEAMTEAMIRWQPALCASHSDRIFGWTQTTDAQARDRLAGIDPGLVFVNRPAAPDPERTVVYAPVAVSGLAIAVNLDWQSGLGATAEEQLNEGKRVPTLKLTPRLVAKLLSQSYRSGADPKRESVLKNPETISYDPEFRELNPDWAPDDPENAATGAQLPLAIGDALIGVGQTDMATQLWEWVLSDPEAKAFLTGTPDPWGMAVNPVYPTLTWPEDSFPKSDLYCTKLRNDAQKDVDWCTLDMHPYANNMHDAARSAARGDTLVRNATAFDSTGAVIGWKKGNPQPQGKRAVLAVTDVATAQRYGMPLVQLRNASGAFVAPTTASLLAGVAAMKPSTAVGSVLTPNPASTSAGAYPLTSVIYAATAPKEIDEELGPVYAALLRYAAGDGQTPGVKPGTLPYGYAPLPAALRARTRAAATTIEKTAGKPVTAVTPTPTTTGGSSGGGGSTGGSGSGSGSGTATTAPATAPATGTATPPDVPAATPTGMGSAVPVAQADPTPGSPLGNVRYGLVAALAAGLLAALAGPILLRVARTRRGG